MALPAMKFEQEDPVEERIARLETNVENIQSDITEMKGDIRKLGDKIDDVDKRLGGRIDEVDKRLTGMLLGLERSFADLKVGRANDRVWWLVIAAGILSVMAHGFKWI